MENNTPSIQSRPSSNGSVLRDNRILSGFMYPTQVSTGGVVDDGPRAHIGAGLTCTPLPRPRQELRIVQRN